MNFCLSSNAPTMMARKMTPIRTAWVGNLQRLGAARHSRIHARKAMNGLSRDLIIEKHFASGIGYTDLSALKRATRWIHH